MTGAAAWPAAADAQITSPDYCHWFDENGNWTSLAGCHRYDPEAAVKYSDTYAENPNTSYFPTYASDCANFVSQTLMAGGHAFMFLNEPDIPQPVVYDSQMEWWSYRDPAGGMYNSGRTRSWSLIDDLYAFLNVNSPYTIGWLVHYPGSLADVPQVDMPFDPWSEVWEAERVDAPISSVIVYQWEITPEQIAEGSFSPDHTAIAVARGTDPGSGWSDLLVDAHTTNRYHAIWHLIPYNAMFASTAAAILAMGNTAIDLYGNADRSVLRAPTVEPAGRTAAGARLPRLKPPASDVASTVVAGDGLTPEQDLAVRSAFESAMATRQRVAVSDSALTAPATTARSDEVPHHAAGHGRTQLASLFTAQQLTREIHNLDAAVELRLRESVRALDGGAESFRYTASALQANGDVVLRGSFRAWAKVGQAQPDGDLVPAQPSNVINFVSTLRQAGGAWKVAALTWEFASGNEP
ncbi:MAG: hypothetical protein HKP61_12635 [Dactylosporangium sp.]|nr:amidase domain-containing protein [Dactylosporangium sp.]NNJ61765.1 hypothetical protein [Dactylosporangium sp.]